MRFYIVNLLENTVQYTNSLAVAIEFSLYEGNLVIDVENNEEMFSDGSKDYILEAQ